MRTWFTRPWAGPDTSPLARALEQLNAHLAALTHELRLLRRHVEADRAIHEQYAEPPAEPNYEADLAEPDF